VVACDDGRGVLYSEDVPPDVTVIAARTTSDAAPPDLQADLESELEAEEMIMPVARQSVLRSVPADAQPDFVEPMVARRRRRPQLRLVK
jgi:hypothetical protein